jgi:cephalosporin hydroxylase
MKIIINTETNTLTKEEDGKVQNVDLYSKEAFEALSYHWVRVGWSLRYQYTFSWLGRPIIQLPEDMIRSQEVIFRVQPDVIIETGVAHGGSLIFYANLCKIFGKGRVIGVDIDIRPHNRVAIEKHTLSEYITLIEGSSVDKNIVDQVKKSIRHNESVMVFLDSNHSKQHVLEELEAYSGLVTTGSYIVATDGIMKDLYDVPRGNEGWQWDNPSDAAIEFLREHKEFALEQPLWHFNESSLSENITHWPNSWLKRI